MLFDAVVKADTRIPTLAVAYEFINYWTFKMNRKYPLLSSGNNVLEVKTTSVSPWRSSGVPIVLFVAQSYTKRYLSRGGGYMLGTC